MLKWIEEVSPWKTGYKPYIYACNDSAEVMQEFLWKTFSTNKEYSNWEFKWMQEDTPSHSYILAINRAVPLAPWIIIDPWQQIVKEM